jgi:sulfate adenylyltransferase subunit 2
MTAGSGSDRTAPATHSQTLPLLDAITAGRHDAVFGGGRRDEERARAKGAGSSACVMNLVSGAAQPAPRALVALHGRHLPGEHVRVFPLSNWTELDIWDYIAAEKINLPTIYYAPSGK